MIAIVMISIIVILLIVFSVYSGDPEIKKIQYEFKNSATSIHESTDKDERKKGENSKELLIQTLCKLIAWIVYYQFSEHHSSEIPMFGISNVINDKEIALDIVRGQINQSIRCGEEEYIEDLLGSLEALNSWISELAEIGRDVGDIIRTEQLAILANAIRTLSYDFVSNYDSSAHPGQWVSHKTGKKTPSGYYAQIEHYCKKTIRCAREINPLFVL